MAGLISNGTYAFALADGKIPNDLIVNTTHTLETASFTGDWSALAEATYTNPGYTPINVTTYQTGSQYQQRWQTASITYQKNAVYISGYMCKVTAGVANSVKVTITWVKDDAYVNSLLPGNIKDETVLWVGAQGDPIKDITINEPYTNFEYVKFVFSTRDGNKGCVKEFSTDQIPVGQSFCLSDTFMNRQDSTSHYIAQGQNIRFDTDTHITSNSEDSLKLEITGTNTVSLKYTSSLFYMSIYKIVGVKRKVA